MFTGGLAWHIFWRNIYQENTFDIQYNTAFVHAYSFSSRLDLIRVSIFSSRESKNRKAATLVNSPRVHERRRTMIVYSRRPSSCWRNWNIGQRCAGCSSCSDGAGLETAFSRLEFKEIYFYT